MSSFSNHQLEKKIKMLTMSQQSIQTLSLWSIHHRKHAKHIVTTWFTELQRVKPKKKMALMYLANDILQNSRKKGPEYSKEFGNVLPNAFTHCCVDQDDATKETLKRILGIWLERGVYDNVQITRFMKCCDLSDNSGFVEEAPPAAAIVVAEEVSNTPEGSPPAGEEEEEEEEEEAKSTTKDMQLPLDPPDPDEIVRKLQELENSATQDAVVRERIANLPTEVTDPTYIDKVEDLESARKLQDSINSACELLADYNARLAAEQIDRQTAQQMLVDYTLMQKYQLALTEERLGEYETKLQKVTAVKKELQAHLENLPDLSKLPNPIPLPSAGDLFASSSKMGGFIQ